MMAPVIEGDRTLSRRSVFKLGGGVATAVGISSLLAACGDSGSVAGSTKSITWGAQQFFTSQSTNKDVAALVKSSVSAFQKKSGVGVTLQVQSSDNVAAMAKLLQQASQNRAADASMVDSYIFPQFQKYAKDISGVTGPAGVTVDDFFPFFHPLVGSGSSVTGLPIHTDVRMLYYRKDLVPTPPKSWDEVIEIAKPLAAKGQYFMFPAGKSEDPIMCTVWPGYWAQGVEILNDDGSPAFASGKGKTAMLNTLNFIKRCIDEKVTPTRVSTFMVSDDMMPDILANRVSMFIGGSWMATNMAAQGVKDVESTWGVAPIPSMDGTNFASASGGWMYGVFAQEATAQKNSAQFLIDTYIETDAMAKFCTAAGYLPARQSVYKSSSFKGGPFTSDFRDSLAKYSKSRPGSVKYAPTSTAVQVAMSSVASQASSPESALKTALATLG